MADQPHQILTTDPDNVAEILCDGQFYVSVIGGHATITFTQVRPDAMSMFRDGTIDLKSVVRARIVVTLPNLIAMRDLLNRIIHSPGTPAPAAGGHTRH